ncbi:MATE family efflux transporter [Streptococcus intermedius]|uniref:MATE family efflux transporter n=1 Tax=Streptococcus intermedius TaxID=1338 RepID=UPI00025B51B7|nr:MATE family efflux transporter [Streptococcus intermedius]EID83226.1 MATE domain protein [Streptococcus intermedius SK54 = ATCC 27335]EPH03989.1 MATE family multidrug resistance protein [Streptococcus intermedius SK54 = ATCC 27335]BAM23510.1 conserved hypothetical protein [Streptococcus intermedius JTH08]SQH51961.1 matE efflux family protein [Streptococcus intermedius]
MYQTRNLKERMILFVSIFLPILIYQLANFSASFVDTTMTGHYNTLHLAGVSMATSLWSPFFTFLTGIVSALVPIIGHHLGQKREEKVASDFYQFIYLSLGLSLLLFGLVFLGGPLVLSNMSLEPLVAKVAIHYLWYLAFGIIPLLLFLEGMRLGFPIGGTVFAEVVIFSVVGLLMAKFSSLVIASHQSAINFSNLMYAFPMSISNAMAIIVSYEIGAQRLDVVRKYCTLGRVTALGFAMFTLTFLYLFRHQVASLYGTNKEFIRLTSIFLTYSLFFQLADTFAAPLQGILRGYKDTKVPFYLGLIGYWGVALPVGLLLDHLTNLGPFAYWFGLIISLVVSGILYQLRLNHIQKRN